MKIKTSELKDQALNWAVAEANGTPIYRSGKTLSRMDMDRVVYWEPSMYWAQGGPIIEREGMTLSCRLHKSYAMLNCGYLVTEYGPTPLIAAMRCYVELVEGEMQ
jgi:Protein of unknown function (DUF2591)